MNECHFLSFFANTEHNEEEKKISANLISENLCLRFSLTCISLTTSVIKHFKSFYPFATFSFINCLSMVFFFSVRVLLFLCIYEVI